MIREKTLKVVKLLRNDISSEHDHDHDHEHKYEHKHEHDQYPKT